MVAKIVIGILAGIFVLMVMVGMLYHPTPSPPRALLIDQQREIYQGLQKHGLGIWLDMPPKLELVKNDYLIATFQVTDSTPHKEFATQALLAIKELMLPRGIKRYRVTLQAPGPTPDVINDYGSAMLNEDGALQWMRGSGLLPR